MKTVMEMAREAGLHVATDVNWMPIVGLEYAEKFAKLVREDERELCAKVCEDHIEWPSLGPEHCADAIRARGQA